MVESDATAAKGTVNRIGLGKARHIQTRYLWLQERVGMDHLKVIHVPGKRNRAVMLTKSVPGVQMEETLRRSGYVFLVERRVPGPGSATSSWEFAARVARPCVLAQVKVRSAADLELSKILFTTTTSGCNHCSVGSLRQLVTSVYIP